MGKYCLVFLAGLFLWIPIYAEETQETKMVMLSVQTDSVSSCIESLANNPHMQGEQESNIKLFHQFCHNLVAEGFLSENHETYKGGESASKSNEQSTEVKSSIKGDTKRNPWKMSLNLSGRVASGNEDTKQVGVKFKSDKRVGGHKITLKSSYFTKKASKNTKKRHSVGIGDQYFLNKKAIMFGVFEVSKDEFKKEKQKLTGIFGMGRSLLGTEYYGDNYVRLSVGLGSERISYFSGSEKNKEIMSWRLKTKTPLKKNLDFDTIIWLKRDLSDLDDRTFDANMKLTLKNIFPHGWDGFTQFEYKHDNRPAPGVDKADEIFEWGLEKRF